VFLTDLADRLSHRVQLTTDGHRRYLTAVEGAFGPDIDYAMLTKLYGPQTATRTRSKYSPEVSSGVEVKVVAGDPDPSEISTSYLKRRT
jgi:hypothetical protein